MKNKNLKNFYDTVYKKGERKHYTPLLFWGGKMSPAKLEVLKEVSWQGKRVLDVGCGTGEVAYHVAREGAKSVLGIDYAKSAIVTASDAYKYKNLAFKCADYNSLSGKFDAVILMGTLEHTDKPFKTLQRLKKLLAPKGSLIVTSPNWTNPRGYMLLTLYYLFNAKISLADIHYLTPLEFEGWAQKLKMKLSWRTIDHDWGCGERLLHDFKRRLPNVLLKDKRLAGKTSKKNIANFIAWLEKHLPVIKDGNPQGGAVGLYHFRK